MSAHTHCAILISYLKLKNKTTTLTLQHLIHSNATQKQGISDEGTQQGGLVIMMSPPI